MKSIFAVVVTLLLGAVAQAKISKSTYDVRHQEMLEKAILQACGVGYGRLTQISSEETEDRIDQGVIDLHFTTKLELDVKIDQGMYDTYNVTIQSSIFSGFDHVANDYGLYSVEAVTCELQ